MLFIFHQKQQLNTEAGLHCMMVFECFMDLQCAEVSHKAPWWGVEGHGWSTGPCEQDGGRPLATGRHPMRPHVHVAREGEETGRIPHIFLLSLKSLLSWHHLCWGALKSLAGMCWRCMECVMDVWNVGDIILYYYCGLKLHLKDLVCWLG